MSKGSGSVVNGYESMVGQINLNLKQPENAEKFHFNFYLNQAGRNEYNTFYNMDFGKSWSTTFLAHFEDPLLSVEVPVVDDKKRMFTPGSGERESWLFISNTLPETYLTFLFSWLW